ncbi:threonine/serine exporter family protein [Clostridium sp. NSJ-49]|jgi:uncharacterized membrane protein YjjB (DUF3815 family)|uniref:Membrane spanning protein n=1 Tax=Clostridium disporicum TaxID=84024 RepID=A0A174KUZ4_9CLOT|nr:MULTISPECIES: threonine/serine exporter family protein [Clostridium]MBC5625884.1 threonine/serine exporter family protein [Clostridium sp. NSJ-49]MCD2500331.1 threonine/serine exporter family protein [Clostridium sp. NSJ-145]MDU6341011.1 threonine/serine exporter family protein [Clostridium sp.]CUP15822.1 membrane spanning protein [Clostridium disporicum]
MLIFQTFSAFLATLGFGIIFNIKGKKLFFASLGGAIGWFFYSLSLKFNFSELSSLFISAIFFSSYCEIFARILKTPVTTLVICSLIPLVPGGGMYYTMLEAVNGNVSSSLDLGLNTLASAGTLALGIIFVSTITKLVTTHKRH